MCPIYNFWVTDDSNTPATGSTFALYTVSSPTALSDNPFSIPNLNVLSKVYKNFGNTHNKVYKIYGETNALSRTNFVYVHVIVCGTQTINRLLATHEKVF